MNLGENSLLNLQDLCNNATVAMFVMNEKQHCVFMNPAAEKLTGFRLAEVQGAPLHNFLHHTRPDGSPYPLAECPIDRAAPKKMQEQGEEVFIHKNGSFYPVTFTASPILRQNEVVGTVIEVQDATKDLAQRRERTTMQEIGALILHEFDHEKIVQAVTDAATSLTGAEFGAFFYNVQNEAGESFTLYAISGVPKERFTKFPLPRNTELFAPTFRGESIIRIDDVHQDSRYGKMAPHFGMPQGHLPVRSYLSVPVMLADGAIIGGLFFGHATPGVFRIEHEAVVSSLAAQAAIGLNKATLYQQAIFAQRRAEVEAVEKQSLYEEAARANEAKDQFLATVSHELRTPLTSILGWSQMLAGGQLDPALARRAVETIERNARAQAQIVEDLLDISRIVSGKLRLNVQLFSPHVAVEAAIEAVRPSAMAKSINVQMVLDPLAGPIAGDPDRLQQIVWNLVSNAIKFTPKNGRVHLSLQRHHSSVQLVVKDNGAGISQDHLPKIFELFTQVDSTSNRKHGGLGLGLAIVRKLVELHGGEVSAYSDGLGKGAVFTATLPVAPLRPESFQPEAAPRGGYPISAEGRKFGLAGLVILLVEDDDDARNMLLAVLSSAHAIVETASSGEDALILWEGITPDIIVSDIGLPGMDGYGLIAQIRQREKSKGSRSTPAVALTAYARVQDRMRALNSGFQMHVAKPVEPAELLTVLSSLLAWRDI